MSPGQRRGWLRWRLQEGPLVVAPGVFDALSARLVEVCGFEVAYASGGAIARTLGFPDAGDGLGPPVHAKVAGRGPAPVALAMRARAAAGRSEAAPAGPGGLLVAYARGAQGGLLVALQEGCRCLELVAPAESVTAQLADRPRKTGAGVRPLRRET